MERAVHSQTEEVVDLERFGRLIRRVVRELLAVDGEAWSDYSACPSQYFNSRESAFYVGNEELAGKEADVLAHTQRQDGSWEIAWTWEEYSEVWAVSKNWWKSSGIVDNMLFLRAFAKMKGHERRQREVCTPAF